MEHASSIVESINNITDSNFKSPEELVAHTSRYSGIIIFFLIFPFYEYVYLKNRKKEKDTIAYPIINHFYKVLKYSYRACQSAIVVSVLAIILTFLSEMFSKLLYIIIILSFLAVFVVNLVAGFTIMANHILLCLLAFQKFMVFFYPSTEKYLVFNENELERVIWSTYFLLFIPLIMQFLGFQDMDFVSEPFDTTKISLMKSYVASNILQVTSAFLYIPIYWKIRKQKHLMSAKLNKPQRYVMWQLIVTVFLKLIYILISILLGITINISDCRQFDDIAASVTIQLTYLGCCKRNLESLKFFLLEKWWIRLLLCRFSKNNIVVPTGVSDSSMNFASLPKY
ncbi:hypothetical protein CRE_19760 [Caenorhabditis remanei]|uniref:Serpentine Receptor, class Z n=1 Tax=Caenorhabditis remanei TaxID=31234 RepID=E3MTN6_CAERE|nr:hypothetical protein CRE_19760 [Caenorhabditis remanei]